MLNKMKSRYSGKKTITILILLVSFFVNTYLTKAQNYDYLIITPDVFLQNATWDDELLNLQTSRGFYPVIEEVSIGDSREYIQGRIQYYYNTYPIKYVLLMGNGKTVGGIPGTDGGYQWQSEIQGSIVPDVDYLSGTYIPFWEVESNNPFEPSGTSDVPSDDPYIEGLTSHGSVYIGRAPVTSITETDNYVSKLIAYYQQLNSTIYSVAMNREILLNGDITCISNSCEGELVTYLSNKLINEHIPNTTTLVVLNVSEHNYCPSQESWKYCQGRQNDFENVLNQGAAVISILSTTGGPESFGDWYWCSDNRVPLPHPEISFNLTNKNTGMPFLIAPSCTQGAVHLSNFECTTRKLMVYDNGGIIGAIAPTQGSEQYANGYVLNKFNDLVFQDNTPTYGEIFKILKDDLSSMYPALEYYYNSLTYFGDPSLVPAICKHRSGSIASSAIWSGNFVIDETITVSPGVNLTIFPGSNLFFEHLAYFNVNGYLNAVGTSSKKIIFTRLLDTWSAWGSLKFEHLGESTPPQSVLDNVNIYNSKGVSCINYDNAIIRNSLLSNCSNGIYIYNSAPHIINNSIINPGKNGIYGEANGKSPLIKNNVINRTPNPEHAFSGIYFLNGTNPKITVNDISGFNYGFYLSGGGYSVFADENYITPDINNRFRDNNYGIGAANSSRIFAGFSNFGTYSFNSIYDNLYYDAEAHMNGSIIAQNNWWGSDGAQLLTYSGGYIDASNPLDYDPWEQIPQDNMTITKELTGDNPVLDSLLLGFILEKDGKIEEAVTHYKELVVNNFHPRFALARLVALKNKYQIGNIKEYLVALLVGNRPYKPVVLTLLAGLLLGENKYEQAMILYNKIINDYPNTYLSTNALFEKFFATLHYEKNFALAEQLLSELQSLGLTDEEFLTRLALAEQLFNEENDSQLGKHVDQDQSKTGNNLPKEYALLGNYPNPFNPITNISYVLPFQSSVELTVYDIMGREVKSFNIASQPAGYQTIVWNGTNDNGVSVSSGVYLYRINIKSLENQKVFVKTSKLMLLK